jgi:two-component system sensor histidine kinase ResE
MVAHDLRNPLSIIEMSSFTILDRENRKNLSQDQLILLESIYRKSVYMLKLIEDYLDVMKIEAGHLQINKSTYDYEKFIGDIIALNAIIAHQKNIHIKILKETDIPMFSYDRNKISQVVSNLLINAINYSKPNSIVKINLKVEDENIVTEIVDNGTGINAEDMNRLFEAFYRSKKMSEKGTGLGLTISKKIIEAHGGTIGFKNNIDVGSTFWFTLPYGIIVQLEKSTVSGA